MNPTLSTDRASKPAQFRQLTSIGTRIADGTMCQAFRHLDQQGAQALAQDPLFGIHGTALSLRSERLTMLASNIANAATPNYKARDIDFDRALGLAASGNDPASAVRYRVPVQPSLDGNTVEMATEQTAFAENAVQYRTTLAFLEGRIATVTRALKGE